MYNRHESLPVRAKVKLHAYSELRMQHAEWMVKREGKRMLVYVTPLLCKIVRVIRSVFTGLLSCDIMKGRFPKAF